MLGQPLELAVDVRLDSSDEAGSACFEADVFQGDGQVAPNRVRVIVVSGGQGQDAVVRIRSSAVVDEPVVGVVLRSICGQKASRRYDFLTDFPVETRAAAVPTIIPATVTGQKAALAATDGAPLAAPPPEPIRRAVTPVPVVRAPRAAPAPRPFVAKIPKQPKTPKEAVVAPKSVVTKVQAKVDVPDNKPRLKLESPETPDDRLVQLKTDSDLVLPPTDDPQKRAAAAAAWRELNNLPVENPQEKQRLLALEAESKTLKTLLAKNEADFKLRLDRLESRRYDESFVYILLGLLLAAIAAAAYFWNRSRQRIATGSADWSHHGDATSADQHRNTELSRPAPLVSQLPPNTLPGPDHDAYADESLSDDLKKLTAVTMASKQMVPLAPAAVALVAARSIYPDDFLDVQQHADFFVSLGQYDQAIGVLKKSIQENTEASPLVYLELLKIYHTLGRQVEYRQQREAFNRIFNSEIPEFLAFAQEGQPLESYPVVLRNIESQWGTPKALELIEACLFRDTAAVGGKPFDLAAYRELLLLYAIAQGAGRQTPTPSQDAAAKTRPIREIRVQDLELDTSQLASLQASVPQETPYTQPMLLMSEIAPIEALDTQPEPLANSRRPPLDLDLDLDLDFSNSELLAMQESASSSESITQAPSALDLDFDLDLDLGSPAPVQAPPALPVIDSNMLEFDLFDPKVEAKISPKKG